MANEFKSAMHLRLCRMAMLEQAFGKVQQATQRAAADAGVRSDSSSEDYLREAMCRLHFESTDARRKQR